jgi:CHAT domain-containing protein
MRENENPRLRGLDRILDARMQEWQVLKGAPVSDEEQVEHQKRREDLEEEIQRRVGERDRLYSEREREGSPLLWRRPLRLSEIQRDLLGPNTVLLSYSLGEVRSFVWVVSQNSFEVFELLPESAINSLVRQSRAFLGQPHDWKEKRARPVLRRLSEALIEPVQEAITGKTTLLISPDGSLNTLPFALLTESPEDDQYLVDDHAILIVPSMSILKNLHDSLQRRPRAPGVVAILADPIFSPDDERIRQKIAAQGSSPVAALAELDQLGFGRLRGSRGLNDRLINSAEEGRAILRLAPPGRSMLALGADANLDLVRSGNLGGYQYIHIASHGLPSSESDLSSLVLSRFDEHGRPRAWRLPAYEISQLDIPAEIVVMSACETGLIEENGREEVSGLSRAFLYAGARRVVGTLWNVDDRATTELMTRFYRALWKDGLPPAEALRQAQREMQKTEWSAPPFWAGFVIQGEE